MRLYNWAKHFVQLGETEKGWEENFCIIGRNILYNWAKQKKDYLFNTLECFLSGFFD